MKPDQPIWSDSVFPLLRKLFKHASFAESKILRRFLTFIVEEKMAGREANLKEYSIAVAVLGKPKNFDTKMNGVVRVHARRLREALQSYYAGAGKSDSLKITVPKGGYIPHFRTVNPLPVTENTDSVSRLRLNPAKKVSVLVQRFKTFDMDITELIFPDHLRLLLVYKLGHAPGIHVKCDPGTGEEYDLFSDSAFEPDYLLTGTAWSESGGFQILLHLTDTGTGNEVWSEGYAFKKDLNEMYKQTSAICTHILFGIDNQVVSFKQVV